MDKDNKDLLFRKNLMKIFARKINLALINANPHSEMVRAYWHSYHCIDDATVVNGKFQTHHYCNNRWCPVCGRIRTAKIINGYGSQLESIEELSMLTLTIPNVSAFELPIAVHDMGKVFRKIIDNYRRRKQDFEIDGVRKLEVTYNEETKTYHPHYHIITSKTAAEYILSRWLQLIPTAVRWAQDIKPADKNSIKEIAKYFSKIFSKDKETGKIKMMPPTALNEINIALKGVRTFQPFGKIRMIKDDVNEMELQDGIETDCTDGEYEFVNEVLTWVCTQTGEMVCENINESTRNKTAEELARALQNTPDTPETEFYNTDAAISAITERKRKENGRKTAAQRQRNGRKTERVTAAQRI